MAFPTTSVLDAFTGTNGDDLPTYSGNWSQTAGIANLEIQSNSATATSNGTNNSNYWNASNFGPDSECYVTISTKHGTGNAVVCGVRHQQETSGATIAGYWIYSLTNTGTDQYTLERLDNGVITQLGADFAQEITAGDSIGIEAVGSTLTAYYHNGSSWSSLGTRTDSTYSGAGKLLLFCSDTSARLDGFGGGTVSSGTEIDATLESLTLTEYVATVQADVDTNISGGLDALTLTEYQATVQTASHTEISAGLDSLTLTEYQGTVSLDIDISGALETLALTEYPATVQAGLDTNISAGVDTLTLSTFPASIEIEIQGVIPALTLTTYQASVVTGTEISATVDSLTLGEHQASIALDIPITATVDALTLTEYPASVSLGVGIDASLDSLTLTEYQSTVQVDTAFTTAVDVLALSEHNATVLFVSNNVEISAGLDALVLTTLRASVISGSGQFAPHIRTERVGRDRRVVSIGRDKRIF